MNIVLIIGLIISLGGSFLWMLAVKKFHFDSFSLQPRLWLWILASISLGFAAYGSNSWLSNIGIGSFGWKGLLGAIGAIIAVFVGGILLQFLQKALGVTFSKAEKMMQKISALSVPYRIFVAFTAGVTEEILFRGYAIGIGQYIFGSLKIAFVVSLIAFVAAHYKNGISQLIPVFWATLVMSFLFILTNNLLACILAHFVIDAVSFLVQPKIMARKQAQKETART